MTIYIIKEEANTDKYEVTKRIENKGKIVVSITKTTVEKFVTNDKIPNLDALHTADSRKNIAEMCYILINEFDIDNPSIMGSTFDHSSALIPTIGFMDLIATQVRSKIQMGFRHFGFYGKYKEDIEELGKLIEQDYGKLFSRPAAPPTPPSLAGGSKVKILGRYRNVIVKGRVQWAMYKGELVKISELRKIEKDLLKL
jgi:hypothetical protein